MSNAALPQSASMLVESIGSVLRASDPLSIAWLKL
jgi:hypothetical protein